MVIELESDAKLLMGRLDEIETKATKSFNAIGTASVAGFYQAEANKQRKAANVWRIVGVGVLAIFALAAVMELIFGDPSPSLEHTLARLPIAAAVAALAAYTLKESGTHRRLERTLRQRELDVSSIKGVLANMGDPVAAERVELEHARRLFGVLPADPGEEDPDVP